MQAEQAIDYLGVEPQNFSSLQQRPEVKGPTTELDRLIFHFDQYWREEGLPEDWYNFGRAGFSMNSQMNLLNDLGSEPRNLWLNQTEQDIRGFSVEYLKHDLVHPAFYRKVISEDGKTTLVDEKYEIGLTEIVSHHERKGSVKRALGRVESHVTGDGVASIMTSPKGETGLYTDQGDPIVYPDSWFFSFIDVGDRVVNFGIKTDFELEECRQVINRLTGQDLPTNSSIEDYVSAIAKINPSQGISTPQDMVDILREVRPTPYVYEDRTWDEVAEGVDRLEELYGLEIEAEGYIQEFKEYVVEGGHSKFDLQKALAATLLRVSELYVVKEKETEKTGNKYKIEGNVIYPERFNEAWSNEAKHVPSYGQILMEVESRPGCAGGACSRDGSSSSFDAGPDGKGSIKFDCPACGTENTRPYDGYVHRCQNEDCPDPKAVLPVVLRSMFVGSIEDDKPQQVQ